MSIKNTTYTAMQISDMVKDKKSIYFIGIGGVSMSCLALMTQKLGYRVGGSDRIESAATRKLEEQGISVNYNHFPNNIISYDAVVYTVAIAEDNPEYLAAEKRNLPLISRADFLGYLMTHYQNRIAVSGMHGKSTTSSMISEIFLQAEKDPTIVLGAELPSIDGCYRDGGSEHFIFEACEYMDSFLSFYPTIEVILNIELDHTDFFADLLAVKKSFSNYLSIDSNKAVVINADDYNVIDVAEGYSGRKITFSVRDKNADFFADDITYNEGKPSYELYFKGKKQGRISLGAYGEHNVLNSLAASAVAYEFAVPFSTLKKALADFGGARRRMEKKGILKGVSYFEDYAHHPTEIEATLSSARKLTDKNVWCIFQSHTYSRTAELYDDFLRALRLSDRSIILDIYPARETDTRKMSGERMAHDVGESAVYADSFSFAAEYVLKNAEKNDIVIVMGAGDVFHVFDYIKFQKE